MSLSDRLGVLWRIETDEPLRIWSGAGLLPVPEDAVETAEGGANYIGVGLIIDLPQFSLLSNGQADRMTLTLNGVDNRLLELIDTGSSEIEGRDVNLALIDFDDLNQLDNVYWFQRFSLEKIEYDTQGSAGFEASSLHNPSVTFTLGYGDSARRMASGGFWTSDQAGEGDLGFNLVNSLASGATRLFPPL